MAAPQKTRAAKSKDVNNIAESRARIIQARRGALPPSTIAAPGVVVGGASMIPTLANIAQQNQEILRRLAAIESLLGKIAAVDEGTHEVVKHLHSELVGTAPAQHEQLEVVVGEEYNAAEDLGDEAAEGEPEQAS